jgi:glycosyltransferase 2 family protein
MNFLKNALKFLLIFSIMFYLLFDTFKHIEPEALQGKTRLEFIMSFAKHCNLWLLFASIVSALLSHLVRAIRWQIVLEPIGYKVNTYHATIAVLNGYFFNLFIPRGGELSRTISLKKTDNVPVDVGIGTVVTERIIDLVFLLICMGSAFLIQAQLISGLIKEGLAQLKNVDQQASSNNLLFWVLAMFFMLLIVGFAVFKSNPKWLSAFLEKAKSFAKGILTGILSIRQLKKRWLFVTCSILIWVLYYFMMYFLILAFPQTQHVGLGNILTLFVVAGVAMAIPLPGGAGSYHVMVSFALASLALIAKSDAIAIVTLLHGVHTAVLILAGGLSVYLVSKETKYATN